ncbi:MAG: hypothetical protein M3072_09110 [Candidatus Dormibacteraeota bacterium]|nr:hypothetical protein [Candidatus Dormibacteraeota bacterium]
MITGLLTASSFLGLASASGEARGGAFLAIIVLIDCLYSVDTYYQVLLSAAVERALDLEAISNPPLRLTRIVSKNAVATKVGVVTLGLYVGLVLVAMTLGAAAAGPLTRLGELIIFGSAGSVGYMLAYWLFVRHRTGFTHHREDERRDPAQLDDGWAEKRLASAIRSDLLPRAGSPASKGR